MKIITGAVVGGVVVFLWGTVSWMVLPWHRLVIHTFQNEVVVASILQTNAPYAGVYAATGAHTPFVFASVRPAGMMNSSEPAFYLRGLGLDMLAAGLLTWLVLWLPPFSYWRRVRLVTLVALIAGVLVHLSYWTWWGFSRAYTVVAITDLVIGWFFGALAIAAVTRGRRP